MMNPAAESASRTGPPGPASVSTAAAPSLPRGLFWLLLLLVLAASLAGIQSMPLLDPDEGRNAEVAREMAAGGDWVVPHYNGLPYLDKPVLYFAAVAASFRLFGPGEAAARGVSFLFALGALALTWRLTARRFGVERARWAVLLLASAPLFVGFSRIVIFDMALTFFVLAAWWAAEEGRHGARWGYAGAWAAAALALLTKGPVALLLFLIGALLLPLGDAPRARVGRFFHPLNLALFVTLVAPWVAAVERHQPGFLHYALFVETAERLTKPTFHRNGPIWYYLPVLLLGFFPWSLPWLANPVARARAAWQTLRAPGPERGPLLAFLVILVFFSLSRSKLGGYILPALPLLALLGSGAMAGPRPGAIWRRGPGLLLLLVGAVCLAPVLLHLPLAARLKQPPEIEPEIHNLLRNIGLLCSGLGAALLFIGARRPRLAPVTLALFLPGLIAAILGPMLHYAEANSSRAIVRALGPAAADSAAFVTIRCFPTGLPYYLRRAVPLVTDSGNEMTSTYVARTFADRRSTPGGILWSPAELDSALARGTVRFVLTRRRDQPPEGFVAVGQYNKVRLWTRER